MPPSTRIAANAICVQQFGPDWRVLIAIPLVFFALFLAWPGVAFVATVVLIPLVIVIDVAARSFPVAGVVLAPGVIRRDRAVRTWICEVGNFAQIADFAVGAVDYVHKPFSPAVVKARVQSHILLREARAQLAKQLLDINAEFEMARQIQLSILPHTLPKLAELDIAARYLPMTAVAGDFYDFIDVDDKHLGILIADVSGHGLPSALIASMLQVALTAQAANAPEPGKILTGLNRALCGKFTYNFVTAAYVYLDLKDNFIRYAGAGHPPLFLSRLSSGKASKVVENGLVLGMVPDAVYETIELPREPGDRIVLCTDGILEAPNPAQKEFGEDRLTRFMENNTCLSADQFADTFLHELSLWSELSTQRGQQDDITLLVIDSAH